MQSLMSRTPGRPLAWVVAVGIMVAVASSAERAWAVIGVPNHVESTLTVSQPGDNSSEISVAISNSPVSLTATCITFGQRGVGFAHLTHVTAVQNQLLWSGQNADGSITAGGGAAAPGTDVVSPAFGGTMVIEIGSAPNKLRLHSNSAENGPFSVVVEQIW